jgi:hypothetical protein
MSVRLSSTQDYAALLDRYDTWMFDCDGVLWQGDRAIDGVVDVLALLRRKSMNFSDLIVILSFTYRERQKGAFCDEQCEYIEEKVQGKIRATGSGSACSEFRGRDPVVYGTR